MICEENAVNVEASLLMRVFLLSLDLGVAAMI